MTKCNIFCATVQSSITFVSTYNNAFVFHVFQIQDERDSGKPNHTQIYQPNPFGWHGHM